MSRLPIFVYGTLRPGHGNARLWERCATACHDGVAFVVGYRLVSNGGFPYAVRSATSQSWGTLIVPDDDAYDSVLGRMDALEGYRPGSVHNHYERIEVGVFVPCDIVPAWIYVAADWAVERTLDLPDVPLRAGRHDWALHERRQWVRS